MLLAVTAMSVSCRRGTDAHVALPQELVVIESAKQIRSDRRPDAGIEVLYVADQPFPATGLIERISRALPSQRWHPLTEDWLNPGTPTSHHNGWQSYIDGRKRPNTLVHAWSAQWKDDEGTPHHRSLSTPLPPCTSRRKFLAGRVLQRVSPG